MAMIISIISTSVCQGQNWQNVVSLDSRVGYSTNTYLNPFLTEWNPSAESGYNFTSAILQSYWSQHESSLSLTGGLFYEPLFSQTKSWKGGMGLAEYNYRLSGALSVGAEGGVSYFTSSYSRTVAWVQPKVTWFVTPFTLFRLKVGSNFRNYKNYLDSQSSSSRFDLYGLEFETWPGYRWQFTAGLYGSLETLPAIQEGFNARSTASYHFDNGATVGIDASLEQYQTQTTQTIGGGGPPMGGPGNQQTVTNVNTDRIFQFSIDGSYPLNDRFTIFSSVAILNFQSETSDFNTSDFKASGGIRYSFSPSFGANDRNQITPDWQISREKQRITLQYSEEGRLYLVGEFNNWSKTGIPLRQQSEHTYVAQLDLPPGAYEYKILRRQGDTEEWLQFSDQTYTVSDGFGGQNAMLLIQ